MISQGEGVARSRRLRVIAHHVRSFRPGQVRLRSEGTIRILNPTGKYVSFFLKVDAPHNP